MDIPEIDLTNPDCDHKKSIHYIVDAYLEGEWREVGKDDHREVNDATLKAQCSHCKFLFLKKKQFIFRDKETQRYCN